jgi:hypothetical protein
MKLFGTILYPTNRYLTLQFSRGGKSVTCEDYFDNMVGLFNHSCLFFYLCLRHGLEEGRLMLRGHPERTSFCSHSSFTNLYRLGMNFVSMNSYVPYL